MAEQQNTPPTPAAATQTRAAVTAVTKTEENVKAGTVLSFAVKTPDGVRPTFSASSQTAGIYCEKTGSETWVASWAAVEPGTFTITAGVADTDPAVFTVTVQEA